MNASLNANGVCAHLGIRQVWSDEAVVRLCRDCDEAWTWARCTAPMAETVAVIAFAAGDSYGAESRCVLPAPDYELGDAFALCRAHDDWLPEHEAAHVQRDGA